MKRILITVVISILGGYVSFCALLFFMQRSLIYFPTPETKLLDTEITSLTSEGETIRIWTRRIDGSNEAVIYFGGNADGSWSFNDFSKQVPKHNLYFVNYRGYGGSTGAPSEAALFADAAAVYDCVRAKHPNVSVIGQSLGSGVAIHLASIRTVDKLVLIAPYDSLESVAERQFPIFPVGLLLQDKFDSAIKVPLISAKTLILIAENDEVIPRENSEALVAAFPAEQVVTNVIPRTTHNSIAGSPEYFELIRRFL